MQGWTGGYRRFSTKVANADLENDNRLGFAKPELNEQLIGLIHMGGVIDTQSIAQFRKFVIRATRC